MSYESIKRYSKCKCGNSKGVLQIDQENDWGQSIEGTPQILCKECKKKYYITQKYYCKHPGDEGYINIWNEMSNNTKLPRKEW